MANAYYLDFTVTLYTTKTIVAENRKEARKIAQKLAESDSFFNNELLYDFRDAEILPENMYMDDENPGYYVSNMGLDDEGIEQEKLRDCFMTAEQINEYLED